MSVINFLAAMISAWLLGAVSRVGLSKSKRVRAWLLVAAIGGLIAASAGFVREIVQSL